MKNRVHILYLFLLTILLLVPPLLSPIFRRVFTDQILMGGAREWMPTLMLMILAVALLSAVVTWLQKSCLLGLSNQIEISGSANYFWKLLCAPLSFFDHADPSVLLSKLDTTSKISRIVTRDVIDLLFSLVSVCFYFMMMLRIDLWMSLIVLGLILLNFAGAKLQSFLEDRLASRRPSPPDSPDYYELQGRDERISSYGLKSMETFKSTSSESFFFQRLLGNKMAMVNARLQDDYKTAFSPLEDLPEILFLNALLLFSALRIMNQGFTIGSYLAFEAYAAAFFAPMNQVIGIRGTFRGFEKRLSAMDKAMQLQETEDAAEGDGTGSGPSRIEGSVTFEQVCFSYTAGCPVLSDVSFSAKPGQRIAIVGPTGSGKTTLLKLLQGLYAPDSGRVAIDGVEVRRLPGQLFANYVGCAHQNAVVFSASVRDNLTLWDESVTNRDIYRAASSTGLHEYVTAFDGAYEYELQEGGGNLSGGQKQLLEITRAFLHDPSILLFDEATRSLDPDLAVRVEEEILARGCTLIEATHVLSHVIDYDEILVLERGRIACRGTHRELMERSAYYRSIYQSESRRAL